jgi:16S rRNA (uracil1498-N3)-methyltransferase
LLVGPEGGLSENEICVAEASGYTSVSMGPRILRTETAPVAALSILQSLWGDMA